MEPPGPRNRLLGLGFRAVRTTGRLPVVWSSWAGTLHPAAVAELVYCATSPRTLAAISQTGEKSQVPSRFIEPDADGLRDQPHACAYGA